MDQETNPHFIQEPLGTIQVKRLTGEEAFHVDGTPTTGTVSEFWSWAYSTLVANNLRGHLAEFIVAHALGTTTGKNRVEWDDCDVKYQGLRIEVKSSAYLQSWEQDRLSAITFSIAPTAGWDMALNGRSAPRRYSDLYVFCLLTPQNKQQLDPTNLSQWLFFVLPTRVLEERMPQQKTLSLGSLKSLNPITCSFHELAGVIQHSIPQS